MQTIFLNSDILLYTQRCSYYARPRKLQKIGFPDPQPDGMFLSPGKIPLHFSGSSPSLFAYFLEVDPAQTPQEVWGPPGFIHHPALTEVPGTHLIPECRLHIYLWRHNQLAFFAALSCLEAGWIVAKVPAIAPAGGGE